MTVFSNFAALVSSQAGTTLTAGDVTVLGSIIDGVFLKYNGLAPMFKAPIDVVDDNSVDSGEVRLTVIAADAGLNLTVRMMSLGKVEVDLSDIRSGVRQSLYRYDAVGAFSKA